MLWSVYSFVSVFIFRTKVLILECEKGECKEKLRHPLRPIQYWAIVTVEIAFNHNFIVIYLLSCPSLIKQSPYRCSYDAISGLSLLGAANWLSNCWKIMNPFFIGWSTWRTGRLDRGRSLVWAGPFQAARRSDLEAVQTGQVAIWGSWWPPDFADSSYLTQSFCCCGKCVCKIILPYAVGRHFVFCVFFFNWVEVGNYYSLSPLYPAKA